MDDDTQKHSPPPEWPSGQVAKWPSRRFGLRHFATSPPGHYAVLLCLLCVSVVWVSGCAPANREELTKEVLRADPSFAEVLDRHREIVNRIDTYERELALKRKTAEETIVQMRRELAASAATVKSKTDELKKKLRPEEERLRLALSQAGEELRAKQQQRAEPGRSMAQLKKSLKSQSPVVSPEERARQEAQMDELSRDADRFDEEMATIKAQVRLLNIKSLLIKL